MSDAPTLECHGCGTVVSAHESSVFRCPGARAGDDVDHVLVPRSPGVIAARDDVGASNPFVRFRDRLYVVAAARARGASDAEIVDGFERLDERVREVCGRGFVETPTTVVERFIVKDETIGPSGSHKARHLYPVAAHLDWARVPIDRRLAIASCGNAALAAAVIARAAGRPLDVFVPDGAPASVVARLEELGATTTVCPRVDEAPGDPCIRAFRAAVADGALPFSVQGPENGLVIEGGATIAWEFAAAGHAPTRVVVQVGGGALLSGVVRGLEVAVARGDLARMPVVHAVQTEGAAPLRTAFESLRDRPDALEGATRSRSAHMRPWPYPPRSVASGILDDETYDWFTIVRALVATGGTVEVVGEDALISAAARARRETGIDVDETGAAGLAGAIALAERAPADDRLAVLLTGERR